MSCSLPSWSLFGRNPKIWLAGLGDDGISMSFPSWRCHLRAFAIAGQHWHLWSDSLEITITLLVMSEFLLDVVTYAPWASLLSREASSHSEGRLRTLQEVRATRSCVRWAWQWWQVSPSVESCCVLMCDRDRGWHPWCRSWSWWRHGGLALLGDSQWWCV
jgi:hypothetical protein